MDLSKLDYSREKGAKGLSSVFSNGEDASDNVTGIAEPIEQESISLPDDYSKKAGKLRPVIIFIISEGEEKERNYFTELNKQKEITSVHIAFISKKEQGLTPDQAGDLAKDYLNNKVFIDYENNPSRIERDDIIYIVHDVDEYESKLKYILRDWSIENAEWIISNPCFEIWLYYHFFDSPLPNLESIMHLPSAKRSGALKVELDRLVPGGVNPGKAVYRLNQAISNSKNNYNLDGSLPKLFSTDMHKLAEYIETIAGKEIKAAFERKEELAKQKMEENRKRG